MKQIKLDGRVLYVGMCNTEIFSAWLGRSVFIGAGSYKMLGVLSALRKAGIDAQMVTLPVLGHKSKPRLTGRIDLYENEIPVMHLPTASHRGLRKLVSILVFALFCATEVSNKDRVILYNHYVEYILGVAILRFRGILPIIDIEDAPNPDRHGLAAFLDRHLFRLFLSLSSSRQLIVSNSLAKQIGLRDYLAVYGVASERTLSAKAIERKWKEVARGNPLRIHFGGFLAPETGTELLALALEMVGRESVRNTGKIELHVTGFGDLGLLEAAVRITKPDLQVVFHGKLDRADFREVFRQCHASLQLRLPTSGYSETTFPSKTVEITDEGLLLVTTAVSDIPFVFDDTNAVILKMGSPDELAGAILAMRHNPHCMGQIAIDGNNVSRTIFSMEAVGRRLVAFISKSS